MKTYVAALIVGLALAAAWLGVGSEIAGRSSADRESSPARPEYRFQPGNKAVTPANGPASHFDASTESVEVALNPNLIKGRHTVICTSEVRLFDELDEAVEIWNTALAGLDFGTPTGPLKLHTSGGAVPSACTETSQVDIHVEVISGSCTNASANACYLRIPEVDSTPPHQSFRFEARAKHAQIIYRVGNVVATSTLVHELGHVLGLSDYKDCQKLRRQGSAPINPDPNGQHHSLMAKSNADCRPHDESVVTGRDLRDLYEAYRVGPIERVELASDPSDVPGGGVKISFLWAKDALGRSGLTRASHNGWLVMVLRQDAAGGVWAPVSDPINPIRVWASDPPSSSDTLPSGITVTDMDSSKAHRYKIVGLTRGDIRWQKTLHPGRAFDQTVSYSGAAWVEGDPTLVAGVREGTTRRVLSASVSPRYCFTNGKLAGKIGESWVVPRATPVAGRSTVSVAGVDGKGLSGPDKNQTYSCGTDTGEHALTVAAEWIRPQAATRSVSLPVNVHRLPQPLSLSISVAVAPPSPNLPIPPPSTPSSECIRGSFVKITWTPKGGKGPFRVWIEGEEVTKKPVSLLCGKAIDTVDAFVLDAYGSGSEATLDLTLHDPPAGATVPTGSSLTTSVTTNRADVDWTPSGTPALSGARVPAVDQFYYEVRKDGVTVRPEGSLFPLQVKETFYTFFGLSPGTSYSFGVRLVTNEVTTEWVDKPVLTLPVTPKPKVTLGTVNTTGRYSISVSWPAAAGAADYAVFFDGKAEDGTTSAFDCPSPATGRKRVYCNLSPDRAYKIAVVAVTASNDDTKAVQSEAGTAVACLGPCGLRVSGVTTSGLRLEWEGLRPGVLIHNVRLRQGGRVVQESATPRRGFNFSGLSLQPETSYRAEVRTLYRGQTAYTPWAGVAFTTPEAPPPLTLTLTPSAVSCLTGETVEISWSVEGGSGRYTVSLDGAEQTGGSAEVVCQGTAGTQTVSLVARDTVHTTLSATQRVTLTVSVPKVAAPAGLSVAAEVTALTLGWQAVQGATGYGVRIDGGAEASLEATKTSHEFSGLEPSTKHKLSVRAYTGTDHSLWANIEGTTLAPPALVLTATATPTSCETNGQVSVSWTVTGGSGSHTVSVDGTAQSGSSVQVTCQAEAGTQNVTVLATDATYRQLTATQTLSLTVSKPALPATVEAQVRARRLSDHRVEFGLRLTGGSDLTTAKRYLKLPEVTAGRWYASGAYTATVAGVDYTLGVVSARLDNTVCPARVEVTFIPTGGERITPERYQFEVDREADLWAATSEFALPLGATSDSVRVQADSGAVMTEAPAGAADGPGREGGLMFGDPEPGVDSVQAEGAETVCTAQPTGLVTSAITSSGARLAWGKVTGASEYDAAAGEGEPQALDAAQLVHDFTGLAADTDHTLRLRARSWRGSSKWSAVVVRTKPSPLPVVTIAAGRSPVVEGQDAGFTITSDRTTAAALTVKLSVTESGDVTSGAAPSEATIAAGARTAAVAVATEDDEEEESDSVVTATLLAGSGYRLGSVSSAGVTVTDDDGQVTPLTLTASTSPASCETGGEVTVSWSVTGGSGTHAVTVDGAAQTGASTTVTCQATAGTQSVQLTATDQTHTQLTATETVAVTVVNPFTLTASAAPTSCETGSAVTVSWSVTGGSGSHSVTVDGAAQTGASTTVTCQATAGAQSVRVTATDSVHTQLSATQTLSLTVTRPAPGTVEAQIRARRLSDNRVELTLKLANGTILEPAKRFAAPPKLTDLAWRQSEQLSAEVGGTSYRLGTISVRLQNDRCPSRVEVSFLPASGERISPAQRFLRTNVKVDSWYLTAKFTITLSDGGSDAARRSTDGEPTAAVVWLDDTADATGAGPGTEAGLMEGEQPGEAASAERALSGQSEAATNCPAAPGGLATSGLSASQVRISWGAVTGASQYDVRRDGGAASQASGTAHTFTGLAADTTYRLEVRARDAWGASGWSTYSETTLPLKPAQPSGLQVTATTGSLTLTWGAASRATGYEVRIGGRTVKSYGGAARSHRFAGLSADTEYTLGVRATNRGGASGWAALKKKTKPTPLSLAASVAPGGCEPGDAVTVSWTVTGGSGSYTVTVDGVAQTGSSAMVTCQQTAGTQTIAVAASDTVHTSLTASASLALTVKAAPTVSGQVAARLLSSGKIEFGFRPTGGSRILPRLRIYTPDTTKLTKWTSTSEVYGPAGTERNRLLGKVTVKHIKTTTGYYVDVCFLAAGASQRICPSSNNFYYQTATVDRWLYTGTVRFTPLRASALSADALQSVVPDEQMQAAAPGEGEAAGSEGGLMSDQE